MSTKNAVVVGSTGMVGELVLRELLASSAIDRVTTIVRRPSGRAAHAKLREVVHGDFLDYGAIGDALDGQDLAFYCLGVYTGQVGAAEFRRITVDYLRAFAAAVRQHSPRVTFALLSGQGADPTEKSRVMYARDKGAAENRLLEIGFERLHIFRPGYIYPVTPRREPNLAYRGLRALYPLVRRIYPNLGIDSDRLAAAMVRVSLEEDGPVCEQVVWENRELRQIG